MKRSIIKSAATILAVAVMAAGATYSIFSSQATVTGNTFSTGVLEIWVNGGPTTTGMNVSNAAPGDIGTKVFTLSNANAANFGGTSTLPAKEIAPKAIRTSGDTSLYNTLNAKLYANAGWGGCSNAVPFVSGKGCQVFSGHLHDLNGSAAQDILHATQWGTHPDLPAGWSLTMTLDVELPVSAPSSLMGKTTTFDLQLTAYNPHRT